MGIKPDRYKSLFKLWNKALILKALGRQFTFKVVEQHTNDLWKLKWDCELTDLSGGYYMACFYSEEYYNKVLEGGPWVILGHYLTVSKWRPHFPSILRIHLLNNDRFP